MRQAEENAVFKMLIFFKCAHNRLWNFFANSDALVINSSSVSCCDFTLFMSNAHLYNVVFLIGLGSFGLCGKHCYGIHFWMGWGSRLRFWFVLLCLALNTNSVLSLLCFLPGPKKGFSDAPHLMSSVFGRVRLTMVQ